MQRLLEDAEKISGIEYDISSYADIVDAIHVVQTKMGITGTTAAEASSTIQGSLASMRAAWTNLKTGIADENADIGQLIENFVYTVSTAAENIIPRVEKIATGIGETVVKLAPVIEEQLPALVSAVLPSLIDAGISLVDSLVAAAPGIVSALAEMAPDIINAILQITPNILGAGMQLLVALVQGLAEALPEVTPQLTDTILAIVDILTQPDMIVALIEAGAALIVALVQGLVKAWPKMREKAPEMIASLAEALIESIGVIAEAAIEIGVEIVRGVWEGIKQMGDWLKDMVGGFFDGIVDGVKGALGIQSPSRVFADIGENMALGLGNGWDSEFSAISRDITRGLDFGTSSIGFGSSGIGAISNSIASGVSSVASGSAQIIIDLTTEIDGAVLSRKLVPFNREEAIRNGGA